jgi:hypothetical protein
MRFTISYNTFLRPLLGILGLGPRWSRVDVADGVITVRMGWAFSARIPVSDVATASQTNGPVFGWGVHVWRGRWLVNGSSQGIVTLSLEPRSKARAVGIPVRPRQLSVSLEDPTGFLAACGVTGAT